MKKGQGLTLDGQTLAHLEVLLNDDGTEEGTLLKLLGRCSTAFGKRLFRIWLCMPLHEVSDINARLDAEEDIMNQSVFGDTFASITKGLPDLEHVSARIHAKNCCVKDLIKVLGAFRKLSRGMVKLADKSESFKSKTILGLLRGAPDLFPNVIHIQEIFKSVDAEEADELIPADGKDEMYNEVVSEIGGLDLEKSLEADLLKFEKKTLGLELSYWHSAVGNKDIYLVIKTSCQMIGLKQVEQSLQKRIRRLKEAQESRNNAMKAFKLRVFEEFDMGLVKHAS